MNRQSEIDETLRWIGSVPSPDGMKRRIHARLSAREQGSPIVRFISALAIAASVVVGSVVLIPGLKEITLRDGQAHFGVPHTITHPQGAFGGASATHVLAAPVPAQATPVNQGRGHSRSAHNTLLPADRKPLARNVAMPRDLQVRIPVSASATELSTQR